MEARKWLRGLDHSRAMPKREAARKLHDRLRAFQSEYRKQRWGPVRMIRNRDLLVVQEALAILLWHYHSHFGETSGSAGGLAQFDSSGNGLIRGMVVRAVSAHPG